MATLKKRRRLGWYRMTRVFQRDYATCQRCGFFPGSRRAADSLEIDHIIPVCRGGGNEMANLQVLCRSCNNAKGAR